MQSYEFQVKFFNILSSFWNEFQLLVWKCNKKFAILKGGEIKKFIINCPNIAKLIRENFVNTEDIEYLCKGLELWFSIESFLKISTVDDESTYPLLINEFQTNVKEFYKCGKYTFLTKRMTETMKHFIFIV